MVIVNNRDKIDWEKGMTVKDLLNKMNYSFKLITVTVNSQLVPSEDYEFFTIPENAQVSVFHLAHGG
jgi:thiamine biosynthesis protein ThiS